MHWSIWPSSIFCVIGVYFLTDFNDSNVRFGDSLVIIGALFWALHIIYIGKIIENFNLPFFIALLQNIIVAGFSFILVIMFEEINFSNIKLEMFEILYAGVLSGGAAFALQIFGQRNIPSAPAAVIMSLESVFATMAAWLVLNQILGFNNILGCCIILGGVLLSQLAPNFKKDYK